MNKVELIPIAQRIGSELVGMGIGIGVRIDLFTISSGFRNWAFSMNMSPKAVSWNSLFEIPVSRVKTP